MKRFLWLGFVLFSGLICNGCGDTFRPIIIPNPPQFPNPQAAHTVVSINDNATLTGVPETVAGTGMVIDVSGDTDASIGNVGLSPVNAVQQSAGEILVVNQAVTNPAANSLTKLNFSGTTIASTSTITLPPNSAPDFVTTTESSRAYVSLPNYLDPTTNAVVPSVIVVNTSTNSLGVTIPVGNQPYAMTETPDGSKVYVANNSLPCTNPPTAGDCSISAFNTVDQSARGIVGPSGSAAVLSSPPIWLSARSDSQAAYVLETNGTLAWLNIASTSGPDTLTETPISVPGANIMTYDPNLLRLYIPGGQQVAIVDISQSPPQYLGGGPIPTCQASPAAAPLCIPTALPSSRGASDPCSLTSAQTLTVVAVAALPDGSAAYVGAYYDDANDNICPQVTVIDTTSNTIETPSIAIPGFPDATIPILAGGAANPYYVPVCATTRFRFMMAAGGDSSRAYLSSCDGGMVNIIDTSTESYLVNLQAPVGVRPPISPSQLNPPQNPVFLIAGP